MKQILTAVALATAIPAPAQEAPVTLAEARASVSGMWQGELQYRDYQTDRWFGIPMTVEMELVEDGVTLIRRAAFDDGPAVGTVYITTVQMLGPDGISEYSTSFRADRPAASETMILSLREARDTRHWVISSETDGMDDDRPARIRETLTRDGDNLTSLKEVDFSDDDVAEWLVRNRSMLVRQDS